MNPGIMQASSCCTSTSWLPECQVRNAAEGVSEERQFDGRISITGHQIPTQINTEHRYT